MHVVVTSGLSRRTFLRASIGALSVSLISACASQPPGGNPAGAPEPAATTKPTEAAKPAATTAAAAKSTTASPEAQAPAPASAAAAPSGLGSNLIGKLEGAIVLTDPSQTPTSFKEAPMLAELVAAGKLPPVEQRVPQEPLVVKPLHEIGKFGGTWRRAFTGPGDWPNGTRSAQQDRLIFYNFSGTELVPHVARDWEVSTDGLVTTLHLRRGMKWSDGAPFTADDFMFWYEDIYQNKDLVPVPLGVMTMGGKPMRLEKVDEVTVRFISESPYYGLTQMMAGIQGFGLHARFGRDGYGSFAPAHYLKQFHPKYTSQAEVDQKVAEAGFDNWVTLFKNRNDAARNVDLPVVTAWKTVSPITTPQWVLERNPFSMWVDPEGNQLPYIDKVQMSLGENLEVINLRAIAGEYDAQSRHLDIGKLPVFLENQEKGGYTIRLDPTAHGSDVGLYFNQAYDGDAEIGKWLANREFRIALSHGIDREQINEAFALGLGVVGSAAPNESTPYSPGPEFRTLHSTLDPDKANEILDSIGLDKKDAEGYRLRTDNGQRLRIEIISYLGFLQFTQIAEMVRDHVKRIGIQVDVSELERSLSQRRMLGNDTQIYMDTQWGGDNIYSHYQNFFPMRTQTPLGVPYGLWYASGGAQGNEPPPRMREVMELYNKSLTVPDDERTRLAKELWKIALDELWVVNLIGSSPANQGVRLVKNSLGNVPERIWNSAGGESPSCAHPETWYFKS